MCYIFAASVVGNCVRMIQRKKPLRARRFCKKDDRRRSCDNRAADDALAPLALCLAYIFGLRQGKPPGNDSDTNSPPDQLTLEYPAAVVTLEGWRLDLLAQELRFGHVVRIRVVPPPTTTSKVEEPHVTRIWVRELGDLVSDEAATPVVAQANN